MVVFAGVLFWGWIWGVMGALLAVPILAAIKIVCDHIEGLAPIGEFLGQYGIRPPRAGTPLGTCCTRTRLAGEALGETTS